MLNGDMLANRWPIWWLVVSSTDGNAVRFFPPIGVQTVAEQVKILSMAFSDRDMKAPTR